MKALDRRGPRPRKPVRDGRAGEPSAFGGFGTNDEAYPVSLEGLHPIKVCLLLRLGRADLAETVWAAGTGRPRDAEIGRRRRRSI